jgi:Flp pilus assembly protein TadD
LGQNYARTGRHREAIAAVEGAAALAGSTSYFKGACGWVLGLAGRTDEARQMLRELQTAAAEQKIDPVAFAYVYSGLGDRQRAIAWLRTAYAEGSTEMIYLRTPTWDSLRSEPGFIELMEDVGLPTD